MAGEASPEVQALYTLARLVFRRCWPSLRYRMVRPDVGDVVVERSCFSPIADPDSVGRLLRVEGAREGEHGWTGNDRWVIEPWGRPGVEQGWRNADFLALPGDLALDLTEAARTLGWALGVDDVVSAAVRRTALYEAARRGDVPAPAYTVAASPDGVLVLYPPDGSPVPPPPELMAGMTGDFRRRVMAGLRSDGGVDPFEGMRTAYRGPDLPDGVLGAAGELLVAIPPPALAWPGFTCCECGATSHHPQDVRDGYCGRCHWPTGDAAMLAAWRQAGREEVAVLLRALLEEAREGHRRVRSSTWCAGEADQMPVWRLLKVARDSMADSDVRAWRFAVGPYTGSPSPSLFELGRLTEDGLRYLPPGHSPPGGPLAFDQAPPVTAAHRLAGSPLVASCDAVWRAYSEQRARLAQGAEGVRRVLAEMGRALRQEWLPVFKTLEGVQITATVTLANGARLRCPPWRVARDPWVPWDRRHHANPPGRGRSGQLYAARRRARKRGHRG